MHIARSSAWLLAGTLMACGSDPGAFTPVDGTDPETVAEPEADGVEAAPLDHEDGALNLEVSESSLDDAPAPRKGAPYPVVLVHGFSGFHDLGPLEYFFGVVDDLRERGIEAFAPAQPPYQSTEVRAQVLADHLDQILASTQRERAHLVCHSQGGLDCRHLVSRLGYADRVATIITVATPHRGTTLADLALQAPDGIVNVAGEFLGWLIGFVEGDPPSDEAWDEDETNEAAWAPDMVAAATLMSSDGAARFNADNPDPPGFPIYSVAAVSSLLQGGELCEGGLLFDIGDDVDSLDPLLLGPASIIAGDLFDPRLNDGIVPTDSMPWGTFLGCIPADHFDQIGQIGDVGAGLISGFDHKEFYRTLVDFLRTLEPTED